MAQGKVHATAVVEAGARLGEDVRIGPFCLVGSDVTLADVCLVPQMSNARRFHCDTSSFPTLCAICAHLETLPAFARAAPQAQPDAPAG